MNEERELLQLAAADPQAAAKRLDALAADLEEKASRLREAATRLREFSENPFRLVSGMGDRCVIEVRDSNGKLKQRAVSTS